MSEEPKEKLRLEIAHVLFIDIVGYSTHLTDEQQVLIDQLNQVVRNSAVFPDGGGGRSINQDPNRGRHGPDFLQ